VQIALLLEEIGTAVRVVHYCNLPDALPTSDFADTRYVFSAVQLLLQRG
jgi:hypothetical protein